MALLSHDQYPVIKLSKKVQRLCKPLFEMFPVTSFHAGRLYKDSWSALGTDPELAKRGLDKGYVEVEINFYRAGYYDSGFEIWSAFEMPRLYKQEQDYLDDLIDLKHGVGISFHEPFENYMDVYHFAFDHEVPGIYHLISGNVDVFKQFVLYFKEQLRKKPELMEGFLKKIPADPAHLLDFEPLEKQSKNIFNIRKFFFGGEFGDVYFTRAEMDILEHFYQGNSVREIGNILGLSDRTVETHMNNLKSKTNSKNAFELRQKLYRNPLFTSWYDY